MEICSTNNIVHHLIQLYSQGWAWQGLGHPNVGRPLLTELQKIDIDTRTIIGILYVTRFWKTDRNVTLGLFHFIGPVNNHTHTLPVHCCITRLS